MKDFEKQPWWNYLDKVQQDLIKQSFYLIEEEERKPKVHQDYSFLVFPAAKAYEGFLKKLFFDLGLITRSQFEGERFRIGRALNPAIFKECPHESVYEKLARFCGNEEISAKLWRTWKGSRNLVFHFFQEKENLISFFQAQKRVKEIIEAIDLSFKSCSVPKLRKNFKVKTLKGCFGLYFLVLIFWTLFRIFFRFSVEVEEILIKPIIWLGPVLVMIKFREKRPIFSSLGFAGKNFQNSLLVVLGFIFFLAIEGLILGFLKFETSFLETISSLPLASFFRVILYMVTAIVEETFFRGYLFNRAWEALGSWGKANFLVSLGFLLIHLPAGIIVFQLGFSQIILSFLLLLIMSLGSGFLFSLTYNTIPSAVWHFLWNWQVILGI